MESWFCVWDDLANPKIGLNLEANLLSYQNVMVNFIENGRKQIDSL
jgi:hypothetical protein